MDKIGETGEDMRACVGVRGRIREAARERERCARREGEDARREIEEGVGKIGRNSLDVHGPAREPRSLPLSFSHVFFALSFLPLVRITFSARRIVSRMAHAASDDVNEKSYILDARKNFEDVSKVIKKRLLSCLAPGCGLPRRPTLAFPVSCHFREIISRCTTDH